MMNASSLLNSPHLVAETQIDLISCRVNSREGKLLCLKQIVAQDSGQVDTADTPGCVGESGVECFAPLICHKTMYLERTVSD